MYELYLLVKSVVLPPGTFVLAGLLGLWLIFRRPAIGRWYFVALFLALYVFSLPAVNKAVSGPGSVQALAGPVSSDICQAIVVLGAGLYRDAPEYGGDTVSTETLVRLRYGVTLHRSSGLPLMVVGGAEPDGRVTEADAMAEVLSGEFGVPVTYREDRSRNTIEGARNARDILAPAGIDTICLVTHSTHIERARAAFAGEGFAVVPAPTILSVERPIDARDFVPELGSFSRNSRLLAEGLGRVWYALRRAYGF